MSWLIITLLWELTILDNKNSLRNNSFGVQETVSSLLNCQLHWVIHADLSLIRYKPFSLENSIRLLYHLLVFLSMFISTKPPWLLARFHNVAFLSLIVSHMLFTKLIQTAILFQKALLKRFHWKKLEEMKPSLVSKLIRLLIFLTMFILEHHLARKRLI